MPFSSSGCKVRSCFRLFAGAGTVSCATLEVRVLDTIERILETRTRTSKSAPIASYLFNFSALAVRKQAQDSPAF